ncbi:hypothetical protein CIHG_09143 [Coccidioides immitis H538.4]|nr:hypothetical protein CIHG_09143 [Coccidioides immitis H538.4]
MDWYKRNEQLYPTPAFYDMYLEDVTNTGPGFLYWVLHAPSYEAPRDVTIANTIFGARGDTFSTMLGPYLESWELGLPAARYQEHDGNLEGYLRTLPLTERPNLSYVRYWYGDGPVLEVFNDDLTDFFALNSNFEWCCALWDDERLIEWKTPLPLHPF